MTAARRASRAACGPAAPWSCATGWRPCRSPARAAARCPGSPSPALRDVVYVSLFPNLLLSLHPDYVMTHRLEPLAPDRTFVECEWLSLPETRDERQPRRRRWSSGTSPTGRTGRRASPCNAASARRRTGPARSATRRARSRTSSRWCARDTAPAASTAHALAGRRGRLLSVYAGSRVGGALRKDPQRVLRKLGDHRLIPARRRRSSLVFGSIAWMVSPWPSRTTT